jgi:hypothetical protein
VKRSRWGGAALAALVLAAAFGCATMRPLSVEDELVRRNSPMRHGGQPIAGYFDHHGLYHGTGGSIRRLDAHTLELRTSSGLMKSAITRLPADSVHTVIARATTVKPLAMAFFAPLTLILIVVIAAA